MLASYEAIDVQLLILGLHSFDTAVPDRGGVALIEWSAHHRVVEQVFKFVLSEEAELPG